MFSSLYRPWQRLICPEYSGYLALVFQDCKWDTASRQLIFLPSRFIWIQVLFKGVCAWLSVHVFAFCFFFFFPSQALLKTMRAAQSCILSNNRLLGSAGLSLLMARENGTMKYHHSRIVLLLFLQSCVSPLSCPLVSFSSVLPWFFLSFVFFYLFIF